MAAKKRLFRLELSRQRDLGDHPRHFVGVRLRHALYGREDPRRDPAPSLGLEHHLDPRPHLHDHLAQDLPHHPHLTGMNLKLSTPN